MSLFAVGDKFGVNAANAVRKLWADNVAPSTPGIGEVWLDISTTPMLIKRYNGSSWDIIGADPNILNTLWRDTTSNLTTNPFIQSGLSTFSYAGTTGTFDVAFTNTPRMVAIAKNPMNNPAITSLSTTGWTGKLRNINNQGTPTETCYWIAIGRKN